MSNLWIEDCEICGGRHESIYVHCCACHTLVSKSEISSRSSGKCWRCTIKGLRHDLDFYREAALSAEKVIEIYRKQLWGNVYGGISMEDVSVGIMDTTHIDLRDALLKAEADIKKELGEKSCQACMGTGGEAHLCTVCLGSGIES